MDAESDAAPSGSRSLGRLLAVAMLAVLLLVPTAVLLHRQRSVPPAGASTDPKALIGVNWQLASFRYHGKPGLPDLASPAGALLFPNASTINFRADCNYSSASMTLSPGRLTPREGMSTAMGCAAGQNIQAMSAILGSKTLRWWIGGDDQLVLRRDAGNVLRFRHRTAGQFPSDYPGSPATVLRQGGNGRTAFRLLYGPSAGGTLWLGIEARTAQDQYTKFGSTIPPARRGPEREYCNPFPVDGRFFFFGPATANVTSATVRDPASGQQLRLTLQRLGTSGLQAYSGYASLKQTWTLTLRDAAGRPVGAGCTQPKAG